MINERSSFLGIESTEKILLQGIIEKLPCHVYWLNCENIYLGCNEIQAKDFGLESAKEVVGKTNFDFHDPNTAKMLNNINELVMSTGKPYEIEESGYVLGERNDCLTKKIALFDPLGKVIGLLGVSFDITEKKKIEELENKLKMREELYKVAKEVSHDIASPVMSLKIIEEMYNGKLKEQDERMLKTAIRSIENMAGKMLSKYRINKNIEIGRREEKEEEVYINVYESMKYIVENMRYRSKGEGVEIKVGREKGIVYIKGDNTDFIRMMVNVINNGVEAIDGKEGKRGEIEVRYKEKGEEVEIRVKDNGEGMSREMAEKIMIGEEVGTTKKEGYGIGMGQIMGTIKAMRGKVEIETKEGEGTEFILTFPKAEKPSIENGDKN